MRYVTSTRRQTPNFSNESYRNMLLSVISTTVRFAMMAVIRSFHDCRPDCPAGGAYFTWAVRGGFNSIGTIYPVFAEEKFGSIVMTVKCPVGHVFAI